MDVPGFWFEPAFVLRHRHTLQRAKSEDGFWAWYFARRVSIYLTFLLAKTSATPNQVTAAHIGIGVIGALLWTVGAHWSFLLGAAFLQLMFVLDCVDGELARLKNRYSPLGAYMDFLGHYLMDYCMILGMGIGLSRTFGDIMIYVSMGVTLAHLGDELLRDILLKARVLSGNARDLDSVHKKFSLYHSTGPLARKFAFSVSGSAALFHWLLLFSFVDMVMGFHYLKVAFFSVWVVATLLRFLVRFRRILRTAFQD